MGELKQIDDNKVKSKKKSQPNTKNVQARSFQKSSSFCVLFGLPILLSKYS
jgi:hypothetical protein